MKPLKYEKKISYVRLLGFIEGVSMLFLLFVAMPIKYALGRPELVRIVGSVHGLLFIVFIFAVTIVAREMKWGWRRLITAYVASTIPFGPFVLDKKIFGESPRS